MIARSAFKDLRRTASPAPEATGFHSGPAFADAPRGADAWLVAERGGGLERDQRFDLIGGLSIGRSKDADVQIADRYASGIHARVFERGGHYFVEDMSSTNGTLLNGADAEGGGGADRRRHGADRRHRVQARGAMTLRIDDQAVRTDTGRQRSANEDSLLRPRRRCSSSPTGWAAPRPARSPRKPPPTSFEGELPAGPPEQALAQTIEAANRTIHELARKDPGLAGMGTTTTAAIVDPVAEEVAIGHVGDSRAYRLRAGKLERLTRDHSLVEEMRRKGQLTEAQAEDHPQRSIITRALGPEPEVEVDVQTVPAAAGDVFLICSDGLTTMLDDDHDRRACSAAPRSMEAAVRALVDEANRAGGRDNITVIAFRLVDAAAPAGDRRRGRDPDRRHRRGGGADRRPRCAAAPPPTPPRKRREADRREAQAPAACAAPPRSSPPWS